MNLRANPLLGTRVLIVEDEYYLADDLSRALVQAGADVVGPVGTLDQAIERVDAGGFDCAIVDMNLRGDFAFAVVERLEAAGIPFVVATGYNQNALPETLRDAPRLEKPFSQHELIGLLVRACEACT